MTLLDWLDKPSNRPGPEPGEKILNYLAELIAINGGTMRVTSWGNSRIDPSSNYGRVGLTMLEAIDLILFSGIVTGFMAACDENEAIGGAFKIRIEQEIKNHVNKVKIFTESDLKHDS